MTVDTYVSAQSKTPCPICNQEHKIYMCPKFNELNVNERYDSIEAPQLCSNCLGKNHKYLECTSKYSCRQCGQKHHTMLYRDANKSMATIQNQKSPKASNRITSDQVLNHLSTSKKFKSVTVLLATVKVWISSNTNRKIQVHALLDQGSTRSFVSNKVAAILGAKRIRILATMSGLGGAPTGSTSSAINLNLLDQNGNIALQTQALVLPKITSYTPPQRILLNKWPHLKNLALADDPNSDDEIHIFIGADLYGAIIINEIKKGETGEPIAQNTIFGWVVSGPTNPANRPSSPTISVHQSTVLSDLNASIKRFWEVENIQPKPVLSPDDEFCESQFVETHSRQNDGRYVVRIPFKANMRPKIGQSRFIAERMLKRTEASLGRNPLHQRMYADFMDEYNALNHMSQAAPANPHCTSIAYLPHHPVIRDQSLTTKLRVVFNASSKTSSGTSINDHMLTGPKLQSELFIVIAQWRSYPLVFSSDITKMYRQVLIHPLDRDYQRILWRSCPDAPIEEYQLNTVTYGTRPAAFLSIRSITQLIIDEGENYPLAAVVLNSDTIVDDILFGAYSKPAALQVRNEVINLLKKAQLEPRKWAGNDSELVSGIDPSNHGLAWNSCSPNDQGIQVLGIQWNPDLDSFHFSINLNPPATLTKRKALSILSTLFDPLGWVSPVILKGKVMMQRLWLNELQWDKVLPSPVATQWSNYFTFLTELSAIKIPRWNGLHIDNLDNQLQGFADASDDAYGAVVHLKTVTLQGSTKVSLIMSKTKVASLKNLKVHRSELQAAVLVAQLISSLREARAFRELPVQCWTDSSISTSWLRKHASNWKLFVSNRVAEVHDLLPNHSWRHVPTNSNPADVASRGCLATNLVANPLWWNGPDWLTQDASEWPNTFPVKPDGSVEKPIVNHSTDTAMHPLQTVVIKFSSWIKTVRVTAYILRFIHNLKSQVEQARPTNEERLLPRRGNLTASELSVSTLTLFSHLQKQMFPNELKELDTYKCVPRKSKLLALNPIIDPKSGIMRVGGRLNQANLPYETQHPVILDDHPIVTALIRYTHVQCLHGGTKLTLSTLQQTVWIMNPRPKIKSVISKCIPCTRTRAKLMSQLMAELLKSRVTRFARAFLECGVDYAGPLQVRKTSGRGSKAHPCYIAVFVCFSVKAVHLELVSDYSSSAFIAAYKRFISRRGIPGRIHSDKGTTFQGASRILQEEFAQAISDSKFQALLARDNVTWHFNPPAAPHFGGLWEAGVKSMKTHLKRILINQTPTYEELTTILCQIESVLNSRPLEPLNDCVDNLEPLTSGHFLIGGPLNAVPQASLSHIKVNRLSRWQLQQQLFDSFWHRWSHDYLQSLQSRTKWRLPYIQIKPGQMVLLKSPNMPPAKWNLARIVDCHPGQDGHVRVVKLKTATAEYLRPISELVLLPIDLKT